MVSRRMAFFGLPFICIFFFILVCGCSGGDSSSPVMPDDYNFLDQDEHSVTGEVLVEDLVFQDDSYVPDIEDSFREASIYDDNEPNNGFDDAVEIPLYATAEDPASGSINWPKAREGTTGSGSDPVDFYKVELTAGTAISVQLAGGQSRTVIRMWGYDPVNETRVVLGEREGIGIPKALGFTGLDPGDYWIEITNPIYFTSYKLLVASGSDNASEPLNNSCSTQTPTMNNWERGTLTSEDHVDFADYWKLDTEYKGAVSLDLVYFKDFDKAVIEFNPVLRNKAVQDLDPSMPMVEDGNHTRVEYGVMPDSLMPDRYYPGVKAPAGEGLYYIQRSFYSAAYLHDHYPNPVKIIAINGGISNTSDVIFVNESNVPVSWTLESASGRIAFDLENGYLAPGYATLRKLSLADTLDPNWTPGEHSEDVTFTLSDASSGDAKVSYTVPVSVVIVEESYDVEWEPEPIEFLDIDPAVSELQVDVKLTNTGCMDFFCNLEASPDTPWLSFVKPPAYLAPGRATMVTFVVDVSGMSQDSFGSAALSIQDTFEQEQAAVEIPISVYLIEQAKQSGQPWGMPFGDRKHNSTSAYIGPGVGAEIVWSSREFGTWNGDNASTKKIRSDITIDENNRIFFSAQVKPLPRCHLGTYKYAVLSVDGTTGDLVALKPTVKVPTAVSIDNELNYWYAYDNGCRTAIHHAFISGNTFEDAFTLEVPGDPGPGFVLDNDIDQNAFIGISHHCPSSPVIGLSAFGNSVWDQSLALADCKIKSIPAIGDNGVVYFGDSGYNSPMLYGFQYDPDNTYLDPHLYESTITGAVVASPSIDSQGRVYVVNTCGKIYRFSADLMSFDLIFTGADDYWSPVVDTNDVLYFEGYREMHAYDVSGETPVHKWSFGYPDKCGHRFANAAPVIDADGNVYVATDKRSVFGIDASGNEMWSISVQGMVKHSPAIGDDGMLYFGDDHGYIYAVH